MSDTNVHRVVGNLLVGSSHFFVDTTNNKVGINTSSPSASLDIATGDLKVGSGITLGNSGTITATNFSGNGSGLSDINSDSGSWVKDDANSKIYVANSAHKVAIGTTSASELLTVGNDSVNADVVNNIRLNGRKANADGEICGLYFANSKDTGDGTTGSSASIRASRIGGSNFATQLDFYTNDGVAVGSGTSRLTILGSGNVGINRTDPAEKLDILGTLRVGEGDGMLTINNRATTYGGNPMGNETIALQTTIDGRSLADGAAYGQEPRVVLALQPDYGFVGIGTSAPETKLQVETPTGTASNYVRIGSGMNDGSSQSISGVEFRTNPQFYNGDNGQRVPAQIRSGFYNGSAGTANWADAYISFLTPNNPSSGSLAHALTVRGGKVGVGIESPSGVLHVVDSSANGGWNKLLVRPTTLWGDGVTTAAEDGGGAYRYMTMANIMLQNPHVCTSGVGGNAHIRLGRGGGVSTGEWWDLATRTDNKFHICKGAVDTTGIVIDTGGQVGIRTSTPVGLVDIQRDTRTGGQYPTTHTPPLYLTSDSAEYWNGAEFRHSNQSQGVGIGYAGIYATGYNTNQDLHIVSRGTGTTEIKNYAVYSDDRVKTNEEYITNATETLLKLKPQVYDKHEELGVLSDNPLREAGLIAQDIYYDAPELRYLVSARNKGIDAEPVNIPQEKPFVDEDPANDPDYSGWGTGVASVAYIQFVPYLIKSIQEIHAELVDVRTSFKTQLDEERALNEITRADLTTTKTQLDEERTLHATTRTQLRDTQTELEVTKLKLANVEARLKILEVNYSN